MRSTFRWEDNKSLSKPFWLMLQVLGSRGSYPWNCLCLRSWWVYACLCFTLRCDTMSSVNACHYSWVAALTQCCPLPEPSSWASLIELIWTVLSLVLTDGCCSDWSAMTWLRGDPSFWLFVNKMELWNLRFLADEEHKEVRWHPREGRKGLTGLLYGQIFHQCKFLEAVFSCLEDFYLI